MTTSKDEKQNKKYLQKQKEEEKNIYKDQTKKHKKKIIVNFQL